MKNFIPNTSIDRIIDYENADLGTKETLELFAGLIQSGMAWTLQGSYGRMAEHLIDSDILTKDGKLTDKGKEFIYE